MIKLLLCTTLLSIAEIGWSQTHLADIDKDRYFLVEDFPTYQDVTLTDTIVRPNIEILLYNIFFEDANKRYLLTVSVLPDKENSTPVLCETAIPKKRVRKNIISYEELRTIVASSFEEVTKEWITRSVRTDNLIPVIYDEEVKEYLSYENYTLSECFMIQDRVPAFSTHNLPGKNYPYLLDTILPFYKTNTINTKAPPIPRSLTDQINIKITKDLAKEDGLPIPEDAIILSNSVFNQFNNGLLLDEKISDSVYYFYYNPLFPLHSNLNYGLIDIYYHPRIGVVGASYESYFDAFYNWMPKVERVQKVMFSVKSILR